MSIKVTTNSKLGQFTWEVSINADGQRFDVKPVEPQGGHGGLGSYTLRLRDLLGRHYEGQRELQAFTEACLVGGHACFLALCQIVQQCALCGQDKLEQYDLEQCGHEEYLTAFQRYAEYMQEQLMLEIKENTLTLH